MLSRQNVPLRCAALVQAFLEERISFLGMSELIEKCMLSVSFIPKPIYEDYVQTNMESRGKALEYLKTFAES